MSITCWYQKSITLPFILHSKSTFCILGEICQVWNVLTFQFHVTQSCWFYANEFVRLQLICNGILRHQYHSRKTRLAIFLNNKINYLNIPSLRQILSLSDITIMFVFLQLEKLYLPITGRKLRDNKFASCQNTGWPQPDISQARTVASAAHTMRTHISVKNVNFLKSSNSLSIHMLFFRNLSHQKSLARLRLNSEFSSCLGIFSVLILFTLWFWIAGVCWFYANECARL